MLKATLTKPATIEFSQVEKPAPKAGEALIEVKYIGVCGSDVHAYHGKHPFVPLPITLGHEISGAVTEIGAGVQDIAVGDRVTVMPQLFCGKCERCREGRYNICESLRVIGCQTSGGAMEYLPCPAGLLKKLPQSMSYEIGTTIEPVAVGVHAAQLAEIKGKNALVIGAGTIGNVTAQACMALGADSVLIADLSDFRLDIAKRCNIPHTVNTGKADLGAAMQRAFGDRGCDVIYECIGLAVTTNQAIRLAKKGSDIVIVGVYEDMANIDMGYVQDRELRLIGSLMYTEKDYDDSIRWMSEGKINTEPLISRVFPFSEYQEAFRYVLANGDKSVKVLVKVDS